MTATTTEIMISLPDKPPVMQRTKYPHTRALLESLLAEHRPAEDELDPEILSNAVSLLQAENEDGLKALLKSTFDLADDLLEPNVLDLMHKHRDDMSNVPFVFLTPTKRPVSRPSSRASSHSFRLNRPDTPSSNPSSPLSLQFRRPHTPIVSPLVSALHASATSYMMTMPPVPPAPSSSSPASSPTLAHSGAATSYLATSTSPTSSPLSSPRFLNAKAVEFKPIPRSGSSASLNAFPRDPSPDLWSHRTSSNLAIASPLVANPQIHRVMTPINRSSSRPSLDDDDDEFSPFSKRTLPRSFHSAGTEEHWSSSNSTSSPSNSFDQNHQHATGSEDDPSHVNFAMEDLDIHDGGVDMSSSAAAFLDQDQFERDHGGIVDGMTPFDVLTSVFGATLTPAELEDALNQNGYDFENTMAWLVDKAMPPPPPQPQQQPNVNGNAMGAMARPYAAGAKVMVAPRDATNLLRGRGGVPTSGRNSPRNTFAPGTRNQQGPNRVCRYFLAGECMRADCRFSHDIERAMCRFWLRGVCAKGDTCEFLHHLPKELDITPLTEAMASHDQQPIQHDGNGYAAHDDFPVLALGAKLPRRGGYPNVAPAYQNPAIHGARVFDPGRTRFAAAVKSNPQGTQHNGTLQPITGARFTSFSSAPSSRLNAVEAVNGLNGSRGATPMPRPSPRIKLRPPSLLPTLPTGESVNALYMSYRQRTLQLGQARNACLARAADAWRRGDGAAAKRFSREAHELNGRMGGEAADAAARLVRERARLAMEAVRNRDSSWSDDPGDRTERGKTCGGGLGVCLGVARVGVEGAGGKKNTTPEERTESLLDLHGLHGTEAVECLSEFLLALEREHFFGLAYLVVGEEKHTGTQDPLRGTSKARLATAVRECLHRYGYPWSERSGIICVDPLTHV